MYYSNPYQFQFQQRQEIIKVNGENGARAFQLPANSSAILLDESQPIIWLVQTDGAGYKTVSAYEIKPIQNATDNTLQTLEERITKIERKLFNEPNNSKNKPTNK